MGRFVIYLRIAWRNLWRNRRRTAVILTAVVLGVWSMIVLGALMRGMAEEMVDNGIRTLTGHLQVHAAGYRGDPVAGHRIREPESVRETIRSAIRSELGAGPVRMVSRVRVPAVLDTARETGGATLVGIDPATEPQASFIGPDVLTAGRFLEPGQDHAAVVGRALLEDMETQLGHKLVVMAQDAGGTSVSRAFRIVGVFEAALEATEEQYVFVPRSAAQEMLGMDGAVSEIAVLLDDHERAGAAARAVRKELEGASASSSEDPGGLEVRDWRELLPVQRAVLDLFEGFIDLWYLAVFIAMGFGVVNTILMAVFERMRELGLLRALGVRSGAIVGEVLAEAAFLLVLGAAVGNLLGWASAEALAVHGIDLSAMAAGMELAGLSRVIYPVLSLRDVVVANAVVVVLGLVVSLYPALKAARFTPVEAMARR